MAYFVGLDWLQREGWRDEVFLDLDPIRDIFA
jgi:hypothetical protein